MSKTTIITVTYNSQRWIPGLLQCLKSLLPPVQKIIVVDNASQDQTLSLLENAHFPIQLIKNSNNRWFSTAVNQALQLTNSEYVYLLNPDATIEPQALQHLSDILDQHPQTAAVVGKVLRGQLIDSFGINCTRARQFYNRGEGESDSNRYDQQPIFGFSGGGVLLRMSALKSIAINGEILDEHFKAYKDDVDLSYRLRLTGWEIEHTSSVVGQHQRTIDTPAEQTELKKAKNRQRFSPEIRIFSSRNHLWTLIKNEPLSSILVDFPWIAWYELKKFAYILVADPHTLRAYWETVRGLPVMLAKRRWIQSHRKISPTRLRELCRM